ncbi:hypothetical protein DFA_06845 [Cavenderia fasciculata]|uniref:Uncharacterized protein n=1 Tax=Cavenderia fasciculata TaxID=261658 RepID=F4Q2F8_CACFS|nr:uncharacterized protein DFA_06845 [Cavenderia fasciculata]EGG18178.1 hypothetical protein DFA_06845 [Cavenderia fasciculata]|eukprot:XP_004366219.1 hypothetical protein DFA_06845 [Cavenderia fasciculata]
MNRDRDKQHPSLEFIDVIVNSLTIKGIERHDQTR